MHPTTFRNVTKNAEYHGRMAEYHRNRHEENKKQLHEQQKIARREVREARKSDKDEVKVEQAEIVEEVEQAITEDEKLMKLHQEAYDQLRAVLDSDQPAPLPVVDHPVKRLVPAQRLVSPRMNA